MEISKILSIAGYVLLSIYVLYWIFFKKNPYQAEYEKLYKEILTSKKYRVKGQYDKD
ncbi:MAG: hypothetical protein AABX32_01110 [Nanoarchaeota archaeon]